MKSRKDSTNLGYSQKFQHWVDFRTSRGLPFFADSTDEDLCEFVVYLHLSTRVSATSFHQYVSVVLQILDLAGCFVNLSKKDYPKIIKGCLNESSPTVKQKVPVLPSDLFPLELRNVDRYS